MIQNRELTIDDYVAMLRRRLWVILIPAMIAPAIGFGISYLFPPKYTSQSTVLVEAQKVPQGYVKPIDSEDLMQRISSLQQQVLSRTQLQTAVERLGLAKGANVVVTGRSTDTALTMAPLRYEFGWGAVDWD